jgi:hypothetical protein
MSKVDFHRNTFIELEELNRFQKFMLESNVNKTFLSNTIRWGIIDTSGGNVSNDFKVDIGTNSGTFKIGSLSRALRQDGLLIEQKAIDNIPISNDNNWYWIKIGHTYTHLEEGTCTITVNGTVTGNETKFTEVLRGISSKVPVKIKFTSSSNTGVYDVVNVIDDLNIIIQGDSFVAESGVTYRVIGSTPLGETVTLEQQTGLYSYDSCILTKVAETVNDTPPAGLIEDYEFWIARVKNFNGTVTVEDKREYIVGNTSYSQYWEYYIRGVSDKLNKNENLKDLVNIEAARGNLDVYSTAQVDEKLAVDSVNWTAMAANSAYIETSDVKIRRVGYLVNISGTFKLKKGISLVNLPDEVLFYISYSSIGDVLAAPTNVIRFQINSMDSEDRNHGLMCKIPVKATGDTIFSIVTDSKVYISSNQDVGSVYNINITFISR